MRPLRFLFLSASFFVGCLLVFVGLWISSADITSSKGTVRGKTQSVELPWRFKHPSRNNLLTIKLEATALSPKVWQIIPDDQFKSIRIDGKPVSLDEIPREALTDYGKGFQLDLTEYLTPGSHTIKMRFNNRGGDGGLNFTPVPGPWRFLSVYFGLLTIVLVLGSLFSLKANQKWVLALALIPITFYWSVTPWDVRTHDVSGGGHYDYIEYVATKKALPKPHEGWVFYHPPTYYVAGAVVWSFAKTTGLPVHQSLQFLSVFFWLVFLVSSLATLKIFLKNRPGARFIASFAIALWPVGILHSPAIGNDSALYASLGMGTWFLCRWWYSGRRRDLLWTALFASLAVLIKSNGIVLIAAGGILLLIRFLLVQPRRKVRALIDGIVFALITATGLLASLGVRIYYFLKGDSANWMISNVGNLHSGLRVPADIKAFIPLDIPTFLTQPYLSAWSDETGRGNFWIYLLRSSLTGEFSFTEPWLTKIAYFLGAVLMLLFLSLICGLPRLYRTGLRALYRHLPLLLLGLLWLLSLVVLRIQVPFSSSNDFRYILPILLPVVLFWTAQGVWPRWLLTVMAVGSAVFYTAVGVL